MPDPHVYPDPQIAPLSLPAAMVAPTFTPIELLAAADPDTPTHDITMFIRVAMSGAAATGSTTPGLFLQVATGPQVQLTTSPQSIFKTPAMALSDYVGDGVMAAEADNVFLVKVIFFGTPDPALAWQLGIRNMDAGAAREFTWVVASTVGATAQPWIDVQPTVLSWTVLINGSAADSVTIRNRGTGPFTVTNVTPALPGQFVPSIPVGALNPNTSASLGVTFTGPAAPPAPNGVITANATVAITPTDNTAGTSAGHNRQLSVSATTQELEVMLLLDDSGSMTWDPMGATLPSNSPLSRWHELGDAVNPFLDMLGFFGDARGKFGIARFPTDTATFDVFAPADINAANIATAKSSVTGITPFFGGTPMGDGIDWVFVHTPPVHFSTDPVRINANRRWLLLMTDGAHNAGTHNPIEYILPPNGTAAAGTSFADKRVSVFSIGYGITGFSDVNPTLLQNLADGSFNGGAVRRADDAGLTATQIAGAFRDAIKSGITPASSPGDPPATFHAGQAEARHFALITRYDRKAAFVLSWNTPDAKRLRLELITPTCDLITPETAGKDPFKDVTFRGGERYQIYMVGADFLRNAANPGKPRHGTWTLRVLSPQLGDSNKGLEHYEYDIIVDSDLSMALKLDHAPYYAGDPIRVSARLLASGKPIKNAAVVLSTTAPQQSTNNWLAGLKLDSALLNRAKEMVNGDSTPILIKATAARLAQLRFPGGTLETNVVMTDPDGIGTYQATIADTSTPEKYTFYVTATGSTEDGIAFRREGKIVTNVLVRPDPAHTHVDLNFRDGASLDVRITPRDRFGNVLLLDPATAKTFDLKAKGGEFAGPLVNNLDGSYSRQLKFDAAATTPPTVAMQFDGKAVKQVALPPLRTLRWIDRVAAFERGAEAAKGANQHAKPDAALGDILKKPADAFVSLGASGKLVVAINKAAIVAAGDNDITVFVPPGLDALRPYQVDVYVPPEQTSARSGITGRTGWVSIGTSVGITQSFSLRSASVAAAALIRVVDRSGTTRGAKLEPLPTPGAGIRGVGVLKVTENMPWGAARHTKLLADPPK